MRLGPTSFTTRFFLGFILTIVSLMSYAQKNPDIPRPRGPVDLSETVNLVIFILIPAVILVFYFIWRNEMKKRRETEEQKKNANKKKDM